MNRGPLSLRKEEVKAVKVTPTPKPRKSVTEDNGLSNLIPKVDSSSSANDDELDEHDDNINVFIALLFMSFSFRYFH